MTSAICPICGADAYVSAALGKSPISGYSCDSVEEALSAPVFDSHLNLCTNCLALFQSFDPLADDILHRLYSTHAATIRSSDVYNAYYETFTDTVRALCAAAGIGHPKVLEIGCNDGLLLSSLGRKCAATLFGVEPSAQFEGIWADRSINGMTAFFGANLAERMRADHGTMDVIIARHVVEHIAEPDDFFSGLRLLASDATVILIEVPYLLSILRDFRYDNVSYSHLIHYSVSSMQLLCRRNGLAVRGFTLVDVDGGSIVFHIGRRRGAGDTGVSNTESPEHLVGLFESYFASFAERRDAFAREVAEVTEAEIVGFGAGAKGQFLIHIYRLEHLIQRVFDETSGFAGRYIPGTRIRIESPSFDDCADNTVFINLAPTHAEHIRAKIPAGFRMLDPING